MFRLSEEHYNIVKRQCKACSKSIADSITKEKAKYDQIAAARISNFHEPVNTLVSRGQFIWLCGYLEGRWGGNFDRE